MNRVLLGFVLSACIFSAEVTAQCRSSNVCNDYGNNCRVVDVCDNSLDMPSLGNPPLAGTSTMDIKPLPSLETPPIGTSNCKYMQVNGQWQNVCY